MTFDVLARDFGTNWFTVEAKDELEAAATGVREKDDLREYVGSNVEVKVRKHHSFLEWPSKTFIVRASVEYQAEEVK